MDFSQFHFENNMWLWGLIMIPAVLLLYALFYKGSGYAQQLERFADKQLLPHLLKDKQAGGRNLRLPLLLWSLAWVCGMVAMAGPRWNYTDVQAFKPENDLVILLDLSTSMNTADVKPSRLVQARERIADLLDMNRGITIGLVAYAAVPHMVVPLTDDMRTIHNLLPEIDTSLVTVQGDRLKPALEMAARMLQAEPGEDKSILVVSDGNFEESDMADLAQAARGASIYTMGVGTAEGAPVPEDDGGWAKDQNGKIVISRLQANRLQDLSAAGHGLYVEENYSDSGIRAILAQINNLTASRQEAHKNVRIWQERFYIPALALALLLLPLFRKKYVFPVIVLMMISLSTTCAEAASWTDLFRNQAQQGQQAYNQGDYKAAMEKFNTPYQHGVAAYKAGQFDQAAQSFKAAPGLAAEYNLGNTQLMIGKPEEAIASYESVLKQAPGDASAKHNLEIAKKMLQQKQQQQDKQQSQNNQSEQQDQKQAAKNQAKNDSQSAKDQSMKDQGQASQQKQASGHQDKPQDKSSQNATTAQKEDAQKQQQKSETASAQEQKDNDKNKQPEGNAAQEAQAHSKQGKAPPQQGKDNNAADEQTANTAQDNHPRTQLDINADQWLDRIQNDPGSFLKNQFMIEEHASAAQ